MGYLYLANLQKLETHFFFNKILFINQNKKINFTILNNLMKH